MARVARETALTTFDNPYDPFTDFTNWYMFDMRQGYNSCAYLDRIQKTSRGLSENENLLEIEDAIDEIVRYNPTVYKKVVRE